MGKLEKLIVLVVLFAAAIVLAISLQRGKGEVEPSDPLSGAERLLEEEPVVPETPAAGAEATPASGSAAVEPAPGEKPPSLLLHAGSELPPAASSAVPRAPAPGPSTLGLQPASDASQPILAERQGLRPSFLDEFMLYTVGEGDTWASLAQRFYRDERYTRNLQLANEDLDQLVPGKELLVPVFDFLAVDAGLEAGEASAAPASVAATSTPPAADRAPAKPSGSGPVAAPEAGKKPLVYEVRPGDTLSDISLAAFGTATRWQELLDANRDLLAKPEELRVGMKLKLPAGAKLPAQAPGEARKPEAKPKTAVAEKAPAPAKKKKVL